VATGNTSGRKHVRSQGAKGAVPPRKIPVPPPVLPLQFNSRPSIIGYMSIFSGNYLDKTQPCILMVLLDQVLYLLMSHSSCDIRIRSQ